MDKKILMGGAAALAVYAWWASRSTATATTSTPSTTPNGVGFDIGGMLSAITSATKPATTAPDATAVNKAGTNTPISTGPAPATYAAGSNADGTGWAPGDGGPNANPAANQRRILDDILGNARAADQYITNPVAQTGTQHGGPAYTWSVISDPGQVAKYDAIHDFIGQAYDGSASSMSAIAAQAVATGTSKEDAAIALGMTPGDLQGWYDRAGVKSW